MSIVRLSSAAAVSAVLIAAALLAACTTADVQSPIAGFNTALGSAKAKLVADQTDIDKYTLAHATAVATRPGAPRVFWADGDCGKDKPECRLLISDGGRPWPLTNRAIEHGVLDVMDGLVEYGDNLNKIATAKTAGEVETALGETKASITGFATAADNLGKATGATTGGVTPVVTAYSGPTMDLLNFGLQKYIERRKVAAISSAVHAMQPALDEAVILFEAIARDAARQRGIDIKERFEAAYDEFRIANTDKAKLVELGAAADTYDQFLQLKDATVFDDLANAHAALGDALDRKNLSFDQVWLQLKQISDDTAKFADLVEKLKDTKPS